MIWVVELREKEDWLPTIGVALSRNRARTELATWKESNPDDQFRISKYVRDTIAEGESE